MAESTDWHAAPQGDEYIPAKKSANGGEWHEKIRRKEQRLYDVGSDAGET